MVNVYREGVYRGSSEHPEGEMIIRVSLFYPYASKSNNVYSHGVCRIVDVRPPFGAGVSVPMYANHVDYRGPSPISSSSVFPIYRGDTTMRLLVLGSMNYIVTEKEPMYKNQERSIRYYTYGNNGATPAVKDLIEGGLDANNYLLNMVDGSFISPNTGDLRYYGFFAMLNVLSIYKARARNYIYKNGCSARMLEDYLVEKSLFMYPGEFGMPAVSIPIWRALPEDLLAEQFLMSHSKGDVDQVRDDIVEFLVNSVYSGYAPLWEANTTVHRGYVT